jgi:hypothetical protein
VKRTGTDKQGVRAGCAGPKGAATSAAAGGPAPAGWKSASL